jgi:hypothetical protein
MTDTLDEGSIFSNRKGTLTGAEALEWADYLEAEATGANVEPEEAAAWQESADALRALAERGEDITLQGLLPIIDAYQLSDS